jgi:hypothetical protein
MESTAIQLDLVIQLLEQKQRELVKNIQANKGVNQEAINLKMQIKKAIDCLKMCQEFGLSKDKITFLSIPEGGSEAYFTSFYVVDEAEIGKVEDWAVKKLNGKPIELNCFDVIGKR